MIRCDRGSAFDSELFREMGRKTGIVIKYTIPENPQANWVEREHRTLNTMLRTFGTFSKKCRRIGMYI